MFCANCGKQLIEDSSKFCGHCGAPCSAQWGPAPYRPAIASTQVVHGVVQAPQSNTRWWSVLAAIMLIAIIAVVHSAVVGNGNALDGTYYCQADLAQINFSTDGTFKWSTPDGQAFDGKYQIIDRSTLQLDPMTTNQSQSDPLAAALDTQLQASLNSDKSQFTLGQLTFVKSTN